MLHCTPPYRYDHPNAVLGYLKGFLQDKKITTTNVYWNLILYRELMNWEERMTQCHPLLSKFDMFYTTTTYVCKHLLMDGRPAQKTLLDTIYSSFLTDGEITALINSVKKKIEWYMTENKLYQEELAGFTMKSHQWLMSYYIISQLKDKNPDIKIVIGGLFNKEQARAYMRVFPDVDYAIWGEGEYPLYSLVKAVEQGSALHEVPQLVYRDTSITSTHPFTAYPSLDEYPFADHTDYFYALQNLPPTKVLIPVYGSRSCPWNKCKFCVDNEEYFYRTRSIENIIKEIKYQSQKHNRDIFTFVDSELPGNKTRFKALLKQLYNLSAERHEPYQFFGEVSPVFLDDETVNLMRLASFITIQIGFEAITDPLLKKMEKRQTFAHNIQALKLGSRYRLAVAGRFIMREIPTETKEDIVESCENLKFLRFFPARYSVHPSLFMLYAGSPFFHEMTESKQKMWNYNPFWEEIAPTNLIPVKDRFAFFGFYRERPHHTLWDDFEAALMFYQKQNYTYTWMVYENGSCIEEKGPKTCRYTLDRDETDILVFCDVIRSFNEVKDQFPHISKESLLSILALMKKGGFIYYDTDMQTIISVLDASTRESVKT